MYITELISQAACAVEIQYARLIGAPINKQLSFARYFRQRPRPQAPAAIRDADVHYMLFVIQKYAREYLTAQTRYADAVATYQLTHRNLSFAKLTINARAREADILGFKQIAEAKYRVFSEVCRLPAENGYVQVPSGTKEHLELMKSQHPKPYRAN